MSEKNEVEVKIDDKTIKMYVTTPDNNVVKGADRYRAKMWTECISEGVITKKELNKLGKTKKGT